ncbi:hypothetical protein RRG08_032940 [Elysia crispata]|uniref:Uncharacterized protein n=1 Tax=Elysia crispata TaxID=231223 RepID=A0AAE1DB61_9GAST|nr:hypothetical protein RRG08_032940 [Elysia crispata]
MNAWLVLVALSWLGSSLGHDPCIPDSFVADTFDIFNFRPLRSYHDIDGLLTLYETPAGETVYLFDFKEGKLYVNQPNNTCIEYVDPDSKITMAAFGLAEDKFDLTNSHDVLHHGFQYTNGDFAIRVILTLHPCRSHFNSFLIDNQVRMAFSLFNQRNFTNDDTQRVDAAKATFEAADCHERFD